MSSEAPARVRFQNVTPEGVRCPSWVAKQKHAPALAPRSQVPQEFVVAFQEEIRSASERPPGLEEMLPAANSETQDVEDDSDFPAEAEPAVLGVETPPESIQPESPPVDPELPGALERAIEEMASARGEILAQTASQLAELAVLIARRVIARELSVEPAIVQGLVREGLETLSQRDHVQVRLGAGFAELAKDISERFTNQSCSCDVRIDNTLSQWGCVVQTDMGSVDESIEARLATLLQALRPDSGLES